MRRLNRQHGSKSTQKSQEDETREKEKGRKRREAKERERERRGQRGAAEGDRARKRRGASKKKEEERGEQGRRGKGRTKPECTARTALSATVFCKTASFDKHLGPNDGFTAVQIRKASE